MVSITMRKCKHKVFVLSARVSNKLIRRKRRTTYSIFFS